MIGFHLHDPRRHAVAEKLDVSRLAPPFATDALRTRNHVDVVARLGRSGSGGGHPRGGGRGLAYHDSGSHRGRRERQHDRPGGPDSTDGGNASRQGGACVEKYAIGPPSCAFGSRYQPPACCEYQRRRAGWPRACRTYRLPSHLRCTPSRRCWRRVRMPPSERETATRPCMVPASRAGGRWPSC